MTLLNCLKIVRHIINAMILSSEEIATLQSEAINKSNTAISRQYAQVRLRHNLVAMQILDILQEAQINEH